jgi:hypothetical protein
MRSLAAAKDINGTIIMIKHPMPRQIGFGLSGFFIGLCRASELYLVMFSCTSLRWVLTGGFDRLKDLVITSASA